MADKKKNASAEAQAIDPKILAYLEEDAKNKAEFAAQREEDFKAPYDPDCILEVRHMRKTFPLQKSLLGKVEKELVAVGILLEAYSVEDNGDGICFNVFFYNVQPGVVIDYATGESYAEGQSAPSEEASGTYIINKNNGKIHKSTCSYALKIADSNRLYSSKELTELEGDGYIKAGCCLGD